MSQRHISPDRADLVLPDGRRADSLRLLPLLDELERLGIPGINRTMSKPDALGAYEAAILARLEAAARNRKLRDGHTPIQPGREAMRRAAEAMQETAR